MSERRYFWLKLPVNFFDSDEIKVVLSQKNGTEYLVFWVKLLLKAVEQKEPGLLRFKDQIPFDNALLATVTDTDFDTVASAIALFKQLGMIEVSENGDIWIDKARDLVGSETRWAKYKRDERIGQFPIVSKKSPVELELELDIEKESKKPRADAKHSLGVPINKTRYSSLCSEYGKATVDSYIQRAIDYVSEKGKRGYADYAAAAANYIRRDGLKATIEKLEFCPKCGAGILDGKCRDNCGWEAK